MSRGAWKRGQFAQSATNWGQGYQGAQTALTQGVQSPKRSPTAAAIASVNQLVSGFNNATAGGTQSIWAQNLARAGDPAWQQGMQQFAASGLAQKATKGTPHYATFAQQYGPALMQQVQTLPQRADFATNQNRSQQLIAWEHAQKGKFKKLWR